MKHKKTETGYIVRISADELFSRPVTEQQRQEMKRIAEMTDSEIDYSDAPEVIPSPDQVVVGRFRRPKPRG